ncbi:M18 family aminopeptidase [Endozoicomonas ascidiicola]|uniref:M18 family aminopeptidase n=1 Tax=Endozoicomonas ascidiicola TaxID=1698521 RepID=UPI00083608BC|nr:M18 family aminopeptidase [Endozoicomonas ascidiicola]
MSTEHFNQDLIQFLNDSPTPYHAVATMVQRLQKAGYESLDESETWTLKTGGKYVVTRNDSSIIAFVLGNTDQGVRMVGAHTDSPCLKVKPHPELNKHSYFQLGVEVYGGVLLNPWYDRDLSIAGRVQYINSKQELCQQLINFEKPVAVIPSLAIHLDREANNGRAVNPQTDIPPILFQLGDDEKADFRELLKEELARQGHTDCESVMEYDLSFYDTQSAAVIGLKNDFIASARLDNLLSCYVGLEALLNSQPSDVTALLVCNDHEEVGSVSTTGAQGPFLKSVLERIYGNGEPLTRAMSKSMLISTDNAHGIHPNYASKHDEHHAPVLNKGAVIKVNANQRYATNDETAAVYRLLCQQTGNQVQHFVTRSDMACGSTIGPLTAGVLGVRTLDLGLPTFGMHSIRELAGTRDAYELSKTLTEFFGLKQHAFSKI